MASLSDLDGYVYLVSLKSPTNIIEIEVLQAETRLRADKAPGLDGSQTACFKHVQKIQSLTFRMSSRVDSYLRYIYYIVNFFQGSGKLGIVELVKERRARGEGEERKKSKLVGRRGMSPGLRIEFNR